MIRVLFEYAPVGASADPRVRHANAGLLCLFAAVAALAATGIAHLLTVSTPDPLSYLGWIIGLSTAAAVVVPLIGGLPMAAAVAIAIVNLVIGLAIGSLVVGTACPPAGPPPGDPGASEDPRRVRPTGWARCRRSLDKTPSHALRHRRRTVGDAQLLV